MQVKAYRASTTQKHGGKVFYAGDIIPAEYIPPYAAQRLLSFGTITETVIETEDSANFKFPVLADGDVTSVETTAENLYNALIILQKNADDAVQAINECEDADVLFMVSTVDSRKTVQTAADKRGLALKEQEDADDDDDAEILDEEQEDAEITEEADEPEDE